MKKIFLLSALFMILFFSAKVNAADWIWVYSDDYETIWIDNNSVGRDSNGFFAYFKETYSDAGRNRLIESRKKSGLFTNGYYNLSECVSFHYFKNLGGLKYFSIMEVIYYDKNGNILDSYSTNYFDWTRVIPDSYGESKYDAAYARVW